ncbi:hypothetical protein PYW07_009318 [Mythimna separata]|uniref:Carboxylesterase type B domain-containing protein n=1 Tax=Mythimna separata TaxID=271217 RepID=A0AAD7YBC1_MYTSE|nr:hypothetical protein PYW07_009318 [Mythimna separata]
MMFLRSVISLCLALSVTSSTVVQVRVNEGILEGELVDNEYGGTYFSFLGIPYAQPPVGDLRFKAPQPSTPWEGVRNAKEFGSKCTQYELFVDDDKGTRSGDEDCLYLNVYTPDVQPDKPLPVMFWIHGGGFVSGSGQDDEYGPKLLVRKDVILVTINYRLEVLGFLCLDTEEVPGNAGLKDQVLALNVADEKDFGNNERFFYGDMVDAVANNVHEGVDIMIGYTADEGHLVGDRPVVAHADDLLYLFSARYQPIIDMNSVEFKHVEIVTKLWTDFARYGNPTPDDSLDAKWSPYTLERQEYLDLGNELKSGNAPDEEEINFWENLLTSFGQKLY